ncbi:uncharacterized protein LOC131068869 [Cryptomeria japonica]|uniref:uncharacterized protein LOC131068869 n=1 Tax=Cryptomeria japonica TaxID=3369 RepID=UPI0027DA704E|nr:uncharacterized protein LOC131068869 [Cryptomeria japonica]
MPSAATARASVEMPSAAATKATAARASAALPSVALPSATATMSVVAAREADPLQSALTPGAATTAAKAAALPSATTAKAAAAVRDADSLHSALTPGAVSPGAILGSSAGVSDGGTVLPAPSAADRGTRGLRPVAVFVCKPLVFKVVAQVPQTEGTPPVSGVAVPQECVNACGGTPSEKNDSMDDPPASQIVVGSSAVSASVDVGSAHPDDGRSSILDPSSWQKATARVVQQHYGKGDSSKFCKFVLKLEEVSAHNVFLELG